MLTDQLQQLEPQWKHTCLVTWPSAIVGWAPFIQPGASVPQLYILGQVIGILVPAAPWKRNQPGTSDLTSHNVATVAVVTLRSALVSSE